MQQKFTTDGIRQHTSAKAGTENGLFFTRHSD